MIALAKKEFISCIFPGEKYLAQSPGYLGMSSLIGRKVVQANFKALHWVFLPVDLDGEFSFVIRRGSEYQYGYILKKPITDPDIAAELIRRTFARYNQPMDLITGYGFSPGRVNELLKWEPGNKWTPDELISDCPPVDPGTLPYRKYHYQISGVVDEILEWLINENRVLREAPDGWKIKCLWHDYHLERTAARYRPGDRKFKCNDPECAGRNIRDFLIEVFHHGGPAAPVVDVIGPALASWAWSPAGWVNLKTGHLLTPHLFRGLFSQHVRVPTATFQRWTDTRLYNALQSHPDLLRLDSTDYDESGPLVLARAGVLSLNLYQCKGSNQPILDDPVNVLVTAALDFCTRKYKGAVLVPDIIEALPGYDPGKVKTAVRNQTSALCRAYYRGQVRYFRHTSSRSGRALHRHLAENGHKLIKNFYTLEAKNAIIKHVKQRVTELSVDSDEM